MKRFQGFATEKEAKEFIKKRTQQKKARGRLCAEHGPYKSDYKDCVKLGGLDPAKYPFAVIWRGWN